MNQGGKSVSRSDENKGGGVGGGGRGRERESWCGVAVTQSDTKLQPKLMACLLISAANDWHRRHRAAPSPIPIHFKDSRIMAPINVLKYGEQSDVLHYLRHKMNKSETDEN